jgi:CheY-like chemotaxis protein
MNILVVDDQDAMRRALERICRTYGHEVRSTTDGAEALAMMRAQKPDVLMLDLIMPGMSGWDVYREKMLDPDLRPISVIIITGWSVDEAESAAPSARNRLAGTTIVLGKPVEGYEIAVALSLLGGETPKVQHEAAVDD